MSSDLNDPEDLELRAQYANEPWGQLLIRMGWDPVNTESSARRVAEFAAAEIEKLKTQNDLLLESCVGLARIGKELAKQNSPGGWSNLYPPPLVAQATGETDV